MPREGWIPKPNDFKPEPVFPSGHRWAGKNRCQAWNGNHGRQCRKLAMKGGTKCNRDGGKSLKGLASPSLKSAIYSDFLPRGLNDKYLLFRQDPELLSLKEDISVLRALSAQYFEEVKQADNKAVNAHPAWIELKAAHKNLEEAIAEGDAGKLLTASKRIGDIIQPNYRAALAEKKAAQYIDQGSRLADKERRLLIDRQRVLTVEQMQLILTSLLMAVRESVMRVCERDTATKILTDTQNAYDRIGLGPPDNK